jgi:excisionase family DNA binding protein
MDMTTGFPEDDIAPGKPLPLHFDVADFTPGLLLTREELARRLGCSDRTLSRMARRGEIPPPVQLGGRTVWDAGGVKEWVIKYIHDKQFNSAS